MASLPFLPALPDCCQKEATVFGYPIKTVVSIEPISIPSSKALVYIIPFNWPDIIFFSICFLSIGVYPPLYPDINGV